MQRRVFISLISVALALALRPAAAETVKIGVIKTSAYGPFFVAQDKGYFPGEGLTADLVFFDAPQTMAPAVVSGDIDLAVVNANGAFLNLAAQGALRIIAGGPEEAPGFHDYAIVASNHAYELGLKSFQDLPGHSVAVGTLASPPAYSLALIEEKYRLNANTIDVLPLQSIPNMVSAVVGGKADAGVMPASAIIPAVLRGDAKLLGYVGDETRWQLGVVFTATKTANERQDFIERFLGVYRKGLHDYNDAFADVGGKRQDGPTAPAILALISKYLGQPPEQVAQTISYSDPDGRLDVNDVLHQIAWYKALGMVKPELDGNAIIDKRYVVPLPGQ